jgi:hypothetical protein
MNKQQKVVIIIMIIIGSFLIANQLINNFKF